MLPHLLTISAIAWWITPQGPHTYIPHVLVGCMPHVAACTVAANSEFHRFCPPNNFPFLKHEKLKPVQCMAATCRKVQIPMRVCHLAAEQNGLRGNLKASFLRVGLPTIPLLVVCIHMCYWPDPWKPDGFTATNQVYKKAVPNKQLYCNQDSIHKTAIQKKFDTQQRINRSNGFTK